MANRLGQEVKQQLMYTQTSLSECNINTLNESLKVDLKLFKEHRIFF